MPDIGRSAFMLFCRYCGKQLLDDSKFCNGCGKSIDGSTRTEQRLSVFEGEIHMILHAIS